MLCFGSGAVGDHVVDFAAKAKGYRCISYVHSRHYSLEGVTVGENCFILDDQIFNLDVSIGDNVTIWSGNHIGDRTVVVVDVRSAYSHRPCRVQDRRHPAQVVPQLRERLLDHRPSLRGHARRRG